MKTTHIIDGTRVVVHWSSPLWWVPKSYYGQTIGRHIFLRHGPESPLTDKHLAHEVVHVRQWRRYWYVGFLPVYLWHHLTKGYMGNPLEVEARNAERGI